MKVTLTVSKGPRAGTEIAFIRPRLYLIGRGVDADYRLSEDDRYVHRRHAILEVSPPRCRVVNLGANNPVHLNGRAIASADLRDGDVLELGYTQFTVTVNEKFEHREGHCKGCGRPVNLIGDEVEPEHCGACPSTKRAPEPGMPSQFACFACGKDLTDKANADGLAAEFGTGMLHACSGCLPTADKNDGRFVGPYRLRRKIGFGGMGNVFLAYHPETARLVAIKLMLDLSVKELITRFIDRETRFMAELRHPALVSYVDRGIDASGAPFLVMQYLPSGCAADLMKQRGGTLPPAEAVATVGSALEGLAFMHDRHIIHRDIKPANILLDPRRAGQTGYAKLGDFGLAKCYARAGGAILTKKGGLGTEYYMPLEQYKDAAEVREPADTYAMGMTLYYMLTGRYSYDFEEAYIKDHRHPVEVLAASEPISVLKRKPELPAQLAAVVDRAVAKSVERRFQTAEAMRDGLFEALA